MKGKLLIGLLALLSCRGAIAQALLFDQTAAPTVSGLVAQDFETLYGLYDCRIADDFEVPTGETWWIDSITIYGFYSAPQGQSFVETAGISVQIYNDNSGSIGSQVFTNTINVNLDPNQDGSITGYWSTPIQLSAGTYWLAAAARKDYANNGGLWYWLMDSTGWGNDALWENPSGGWNTGCSGWTNFTASCLNLNFTDVLFRIHGCYGSTKPAISGLGNDTTFCEGPSVTLSANTTATGVAYIWNNGATTQSITTDSAGYYKVIVYDTTTLCGSYADINLNILPAPHSNISDDTICPGKTKTFNGSACATCQYEWQDGSSAVFYSTSTEGWVVLTITNSSTGCVAVDSAWLEIEDVDPIEFIPGSPVYLCEGDTATVSLAGSYETYVWNSDLFSAPFYAASIAVDEGGLYYVTVTTPNNCILSDTVSVEIQPLPEPTITIDYTANWKTRLTAPPGYLNYLWSNGETDPIIVVNTTGGYSVTVTDIFGCEGSTSIFVITGIEDAAGGRLKVFPNPADNVLYISWPEHWLGNAEMSITDASGRNMKTLMAEAHQQQTDISALPAGYYILRVRTPEGVYVAPIIVE